jgi:hypothetical protein
MSAVVIGFVEEYVSFFFKMIGVPDGIPEVINNRGNILVPISMENMTFFISRFILIQMAFCGVVFSTMEMFSFIKNNMNFSLKKFMNKTTETEDYLYKKEFIELMDQLPLDLDYVSNGEDDSSSSSGLETEDES